jgi:phosphatidylserine decarboxylase
VPVAAQALPFLIASGALGAALAAAFGPWGSVPSIVLALFVLFFFRDPERESPAGEGTVLAPADGRVTAVEQRPDGGRVSIFLSLFDCHINRSPVSGIVSQAHHTPGRFHPAWQGRASSENERNRLVIVTDGGAYGVTQVAGVLARRIVCRKRPGDRVGKGERIGLIRFGSRTDLDLPAGVRLEVAVGDRVRGGLTVVAREARAPAPDRQLATAGRTLSGGGA